jgi:hypothetical protein
MTPYIIFNLDLDCELWVSDNGHCTIDGLCACPKGRYFTLDGNYVEVDENGYLTSKEIRSMLPRRAKKIIIFRFLRFV